MALVDKILSNFLVPIGASPGCYPIGVAALDLLAGSLFVIFDALPS